MVQWYRMILNGSFCKGNENLTNDCEQNKSHFWLPRKFIPAYTFATHWNHESRKAKHFYATCVWSVWTWHDLKHLRGVQSREHIGHRSLPCEVVKGARFCIDAEQKFVCEPFIIPCTCQVSTSKYHQIVERITFSQTWDVFKLSTVEDKSTNRNYFLCCCCWRDPVIVCPRYRVVGISLHQHISNS